jgi:hypothetical protein
MLPISITFSHFTMRLANYKERSQFDDMFAIPWLSLRLFNSNHSLVKILYSGIKERVKNKEMGLLSSSSTNITACLETCKISLV